MGLQQQIDDDLRTAMKARERARTATLRLLVTALRNEAINQGLGAQGELDDDTVQRLVQTEVKRRREAAEAFRGAGRAEQAAAEEAEAALLEPYLPVQLDDDALGAVIDEEIAAAGAEGPRAMGVVMKAVMARVAGQADGSRVSTLVRQRLVG